ncbi:hypothetical protein [uncultured Paludibaculum sp.]|uniref:hypothetical protein n=1 Tax=uncultured Paludibaculum sp. TaxID=1765020 RepID=UPI002AABDF20|nr:hypothetical protein [uncultured Paludibaculum sp.]
MPKPGRKVWYLRIHGCDYEVVRRMDLEAEERFVERPFVSSTTFDRWLKEPVTARRLSDMLASVMPLPQRNALEDKRWLSSRLDEAFRKGRLVLLEQEEAPAPAPSSGGGGGQSQTQNAPPPAPPAGGAGAGAPAKTWIEFKLVDNNDKPIANERYKVKLTDGSTKEGHLSAGGTVRFAGIDPGNCDISFPDLDARDWTAA